MEDLNETIKKVVELLPYEIKTTLLFIREQLDNKGYCEVGIIPVEYYNYCLGFGLIKKDVITVDFTQVGRNIVEYCTC